MDKEVTESIQKALKTIEGVINGTIDTEKDPMAGLSAYHAFITVDLVVKNYLGLTKELKKNKKAND